MKNIGLSVLMLAYNSQDYIEQAIQSILNQTYTNFELVIIEDCSSDSTLQIIESFSDSRIKLHRNKIRQGISKSRNIALNHAQGEYISFFDSDDIAAPLKFEKQIVFLNKNPGYGFVGSNVKIINHNGSVINKWKLDTKPACIKPIMVFHNYFVNSSVVFRKSILYSTKFNENFEIGEDYLFWWEILSRSKAYNLPEYLTYYRQHEKSVMAQNTNYRFESEKDIYIIILSDLGISSSIDELRLHVALKELKKVKSKAEIIEYKNWLIKIFSGYLSKNEQDVKYIRKVIVNRWVKICFASRSNPVNFIFTIFQGLKIYFYTFNKING